MINTINRYELSFKDIDGNVGASMFSNIDFEGLDGDFVGGLCTDSSGNIYISDPEQHAIFRVNGLDGSISVFAGLPGTSGDNGGAAVDKFDARFNTPSGLSCDASGNIYVADKGNNQVRVIGPQGKVSLFAGLDTCVGGFDASGVPTACRLNAPQDVCVDSAGKVYIADTDNHAIRMVWGGLLTTLAGNGASGDVVGTTAAARFDSPYSVAVNKRGDVMVADSGNLKVKMIRNSHVYLMFGTGAYGDDLSAGELHILSYSDVDARGNFFVLDIDSRGGATSRVLKIDEMSVASVAVDFPDQTYDVMVKGFALNKSNELFVALSQYSLVSSSSSTEHSSASSASESSQSSVTDQGP